MSGNRRSIKADVRLHVWVRSGGRCAICNDYLLESRLTAREHKFGAMAHNVGQSTSPLSPRGDDPLPLSDRDQADNILLLCGSCHDEVDKLAQIDCFPVSKMTEIKAAHEKRVFAATELVSASDTAVLRVHGHVRGAPVDISKATAATAVLASSSRFPRFPLSYDRQGVEIDLRQFASEAEPSNGYYSACAARIDEVLKAMLQPAVEKGDVDHISVFALTRLPLLVHLGSRIDDAVACDIYERHRDTQSWIWPEQAPTVEFVHYEDSECAPNATEAVLIVNASGTVHARELPAEVAGLPLFRVAPINVTPQVGTVASRASRDSFEIALRELLGRLEATAKGIRQLHLFAAAPVSVAVTLGRSVGWGIQPDFITYDRIDGTYHRALEITAP